VNAPFQTAITSLRALAVAMVRAACSESGGAADRIDAAAIVGAVSAAPPDEEAVLVGLARRFGLSDGELLAATLCLAVESDPHAARLVAAAQAPVGTSRPLAGFAATVFGGVGLDCIDLASGTAARIGLIVLGDEAAPLTERSIRIPLPIVAALAGRRLEPEGLRPIVAGRTALPPTLRDEAVAHAGRIGRIEGASVLVIRSPSIRESLALAQIVADRLGLVGVDMGQESPSAHSCWLAATGSMPVMTHRLGPGEQCRIDPPGDHRGPIVVLAGSEGVVEAPMPISEWWVAIPDEAERALLWRAGGLDPAAAGEAARAYRQGAGRIAEIVERVETITGAGAPGWADLTAAIESGASQLDRLARRSSARVEREDLVVPAPLGASLDRLLDRIRLRNRLSTDLGPSLRARYRPGVRALFTGESGTGKTLAVHWLARRTGLPLYRVDLAAMTSKWIGETEKNLSAVLDAAQHADVVLFFDEADSLFGARTDVGDSHDRFANAQTNYLLQRIEDFDGVAILATNSRDRFDPAFVRRLDSILEFPLPGAAARRDLWRAHLGEGHALSAREIDTLSVAVDLAGGHIRNMVLAAAVPAASDGRPIAFTDVAAGMAEEYGKLGRAPPDLPAC
jgi:hypothetical protein